MTSPTRVRVLTPEALDAAAANLVNTSGTQLSTAVANHAGTGTATVSGSTTATANSLMQRDANGRSQVATPSVSADIATKGYVDTAVSSYVLTSSRGAASGVASLDSNSWVPANQIAPLFPRNLGSGTAFPSSPNLGDLYTHTGIGCSFRWGGTQWEQMGRCTVANRTARNALLNNYNALLPQGFRVTQTNFGWVWKKDNSSWVYAGFEGTTAFANASNTGTNFSYVALNQSISSSSSTALGSFSYAAAGSTDTQREVVTLGGATNNTWTFNDRCLVAIQGYVWSDSAGVASRSDVGVTVPGGTKVTPYSGINNTSQRASGYSGSGYLEQPFHWVGYADVNSTTNIFIYQYNPNGTAISYNCNITFTLLPS